MIYICLCFTFQINDLERHLEACREKNQTDVFEEDLESTEHSLIDEIDTVMTTDALYHRLSELKLELAETERNLREVHHKALRNCESMFLSHGNLSNTITSSCVSCRSIDTQCDVKCVAHERQQRTHDNFNANTRATLLDANAQNAANTTVHVRSPQAGITDHNTRHRPTRRQTLFAGITPRRACSLRDPYVPVVKPNMSGPSTSSGIHRRPTFALAKAPVRRYDSDSAYIVTKNSKSSGLSDDPQHCRPSPLQHMSVTSIPVTAAGLPPRIRRHAPLRRVVEPQSSLSFTTPRYSHSLVTLGDRHNDVRHGPDEKIPPTVESRNSPPLPILNKEQNPNIKDERKHRRQHSDGRNDTATYDSGVGTMSDCQDNPTEGCASRWRDTADTPQTGWMGRQSVSITGHQGVLPSKPKAFMPSNAHVNGKLGCTSGDHQRIPNTLTKRVGDVDIEALSSKYELRCATAVLAGGERCVTGQQDDRTRRGATEDSGGRKYNIGDGDFADAAKSGPNITRGQGVEPSCEDISKGGCKRQRNVSDSSADSVNCTSDVQSIRRQNTSNCSRGATIALTTKDTPHRRLTRNGVSPCNAGTQTKTRTSECHQCGTFVSRETIIKDCPSCCSNGSGDSTHDISAEALSHIAVSMPCINNVHTR